MEITDKGFLIHCTREDYHGLKIKCEHEVVQAFTDYDGTILPVGWKGVFRGWNYFPYDDGLTLCFECGTDFYNIRLQDRPAGEQKIINTLHLHFRNVTDPQSDSDYVARANKGAKHTVMNAWYWKLRNRIAANTPILLLLFFITQFVIFYIKGSK